MCGRFTQTKSRKEVLDQLANIELPPLFHRRYNIAPSQTVAVIRQDEPTRPEECIWGFEKPVSKGLVINARLETLAERPMFKDLLANHRCLIPADGFYEWKGKQPYYFQLPEKELFAFAGLWRDDRCCIITRTADQYMKDIHDRMPVILTPDHWNRWLENFKPVVAPQLTIRPVSRRVNKVDIDDPACLDPIDEQTDLSLFTDDE